TADFIIFANGEYVYSDSWRAEGAAGGSFSAGPPDSAIGNTLAKLSLAAIPASSYQKWDSHYSKLYEIAAWQGEAWGRAGLEFVTPDTKKTIQQFHKAALKK
ncbi:MAG TPA: hypothetical protein VEF04_10090, partial [Blastocatellia bacterium]|nr:hypothetical protein [Blastocatellia bacterium]